MVRRHACACTRCIGNIDSQSTHPALPAGHASRVLERLRPTKFKGTAAMKKLSELSTKTIPLLARQRPAAVGMRNVSGALYGPRIPRRRAGLRVWLPGLRGPWRRALAGGVAGTMASTMASTITASTAGAPAASLMPAGLATAAAASTAAAAASTAATAATSGAAEPARRRWRTLRHRHRHHHHRGSGRYAGRKNPSVMHAVRHNVPARTTFGRARRPICAPP